VFLLVEQDTVGLAGDVGLGEMVGCCGLSKEWYGEEGCYIHNCG
jgi:hypothetical protein